MAKKMNGKMSSMSMHSNNMCMCGCHGTWAMVAGILVVIGALNWGLYGLGMLMGAGNWNVVNWIFGSWPALEAIIYVIVGIAGISMLVGLCKGCK